MGKNEILYYLEPSAQGGSLFFTTFFFHTNMYAYDVWVMVEPQVMVEAWIIIKAWAMVEAQVMVKAQMMVKVWAMAEA